MMSKVTYRNQEKTTVIATFELPNGDTIELPVGLNLSYTQPHYDVFSMGAFPPPISVDVSLKLKLVSIELTEGTQRGNIAIDKDVEFEASNIRARGATFEATPQSEAT